MLLSVNEALFLLNSDGRFIKTVNKYICDGDNTLFDIDSIPFELDNDRIILVITFDDAHILLQDKEYCIRWYLLNKDFSEHAYKYFMSKIVSCEIKKRIKGDDNND